MNSLRRFSTRLHNSPAAFCGLLAACTVLVAAASLAIGAVRLTPAEVLRALFSAERESVAARVVLYSRLPRTCGSLLAGAALGAAGVLIQTVLANPLAAPHTIGVNAGAALAVTICTAFLPGTVYTPLAAFVGAMAAALAVVFFAEKTGASRMTLVLAGVAVSSFLTAAIDAVVTLVPDALAGYSDFRVGGLAGVTMARIAPAAVLILVALALALGLTGQMDILALGPETAQSLGLRVKPVRLALVILAAALAGGAVSFCGLVGFVGLIVPHAVRRFVGEESRPLLVGSALGGACFMTLCDLLARTVAAPYELPVGLVLSFVGAPFFLWLLVRRKGGHTGG